MLMFKTIIIHIINEVILINPKVSVGFSLFSLTFIRLLVCKEIANNALDFTVKRHQSRQGYKRTLVVRLWVLFGSNFVGA